MKTVVRISFVDRPNCGSVWRWWFNLVWPMRSRKKSPEMTYARRLECSGRAGQEMRFKWEEVFEWRFTVRDRHLWLAGPPDTDGYTSPGNQHCRNEISASEEQSQVHPIVRYRANVWKENRLSQKFRLQRGTRQGCSQSPGPFGNIYRTPGSCNLAN